MARCLVLRYLDRATDVVIAFSIESLPRLDAGWIPGLRRLRRLLCVRKRIIKPIQAPDLSFNLWRGDEARTKALLRCLRWVVTRFSLHWLS